jgi:hypothetical protein
MGEGLAEWTVTAPSGEQTILQMAYFDRSQAPVDMEVGPVLALEDVAGARSPRWPAASKPATTPTPPGCWTATDRRS